MSSAYVRRKELSSEAASNQAACDAGAPLSPLGYTARSAGCAPRTSVGTSFHRLGYARAALYLLRWRIFLRAMGARRA